MPDYPSEYDQPETCDVCGKDSEDCDCPECPRCGSVGDPGCYAEHGLEPALDSIRSFCQHIGIEPIGAALRAIDRHNTEHVWLVLAVPLWLDSTNEKVRVYYHDGTAHLSLEPWMRLRAVGVGGIAWDGTDWEWATEVEAGGEWWALDQAREDFHDALDEHHAIAEEDV